jgi:hypothetical protein
MSKLAAPLNIELAKKAHLEPIVFIGFVGLVFMLVPLIFLKETLPSKKNEIQIHTM